MAHIVDSALSVVGERATVLKEEVGVLVELLSPKWKGMALANKLLRWTNCVTMVLATVIFAAFHLSFVNVGEVCTAPDTPSNCWDDGGPYRATDFTMLTTRLSFTDIAAGQNRIWDNSMTKRSVDAYSVVFAPDKDTQGSLASVCNYADHWNQTRCTSEKISPLYEIPNSRTDYTLSGGVQIGYLFFVSLHIAAAFAIMMLPEVRTAASDGKGGSVVSANMEVAKMIVLMGWYIGGILCVILFYVADDLTNMRVPVNNVSLAIMIEVFAMFVQFSWALNSLKPFALEEFWRDFALAVHAHDSDPDMVSGTLSYVANSPPMVPEGGSFNDDSRSMEAAASGTGGALSSLMRISGMPGGHSRDGIKYAQLGYRFADKQYASNGQLKTADGTYVKINRFDMSVYETKIIMGEVLEPFMIECALTMPLLLSIAYAVGHRSTYDFVLQSIYTRTFLFFGALSVTAKVFGARYLGTKRMQYERKASAEAHVLHADHAAYAVGAFLVTTATIMFGFMLYSWFNPLRIVTWDNRAIGDAGSAAAFVVITLVFTVLIACISCAILFGSVLMLIFSSQEIEPGAMVGVQSLLTLLLWVLRIIMFIYMLMPDSILGSVNPEDVVLGYPM